MPNIDFSNKEEVLKYITELENKINYLENNKKYGLVWEDNRVSKDKKEFIEVKDKNIGKNSNLPSNLLLEGDNFYSLKWLSSLYKKVDVIYIDPPYNTGNKEFIYNDNYRDRELKFKHSSWLSFMAERLEVAKELLNDDGVILMSIDEHEYAHLKLLCNEIFGEENFVNTFMVKRATKNLNNQFKKVISLNQAFEYILVYKKSNQFSYKNAYKETSDKRKEGYWTGFYSNANRPTMRYDIDGVNIEKGQWKWSQERGLRALDNYKYYLTNYSKQYSLKDYWLKFKNSYKEETGFELEFVRRHNNTAQYWVKASDKTLMDTNLMDYYINDNRGKSLYKFDTVKNLNTIKKLISMFSNNDSVILDFFAGSGTTGHAVLELNKEDNGSRQFILCTNNENNICEEITYSRIANVINGFTDEKGKVFKGTDANLKYFRLLD